MNMPRIVILDGYTLNPGDLDWSGLAALGELVVYDRTAVELVVERSRGAGIVLTNKTPLSAEALERLPDLRAIGVLATGYNVVDTAAARARGIPVMNVPGYGTAAVAQHVFALLLELTTGVSGIFLSLNCPVLRWGLSGWVRLGVRLRGSRGPLG
jgi:glycerate dehydrogenase